MSSTPRIMCVSRPNIIECENDEAAIEKAHQLLDGLAIEVWEKERKVGRLEPRAAK
jgi:hypothetical protein